MLYLETLGTITRFDAQGAQLLIIENPFEIISKSLAPLGKGKLYDVGDGPHIVR